MVQLTRQDLHETASEILSTNLQPIKDKLEDVQTKLEEKLSTVQEAVDKNIEIAKDKVNERIENTKQTAKTFRADIPSFILVISLYIFQGISLALVTSTIPFILQKRLNVIEYGVLTFSLVPYSMKLLWAPLIDTFYIKEIGRRKTWIVGAHLMCSLILNLLSRYNDALFSQKNVNIFNTTLAISALTSVLSIQETAIDGWVTNLFHEIDIGYSVLCQTIGYSIGYAMAYNGFLALESRELINFATFLLILSAAYFVFALTITFAVKEKKCDVDAEMVDKHNNIETLVDAYRAVYRIMQLPNIKHVLGTFLIFGVSFSISDSLVPIKLSYRGFETSSLWSLAPIAVPFMIVAFVASIYLSSKIAAFKIWKGAFMMKLLFVGIMLLLAFVYPHMDNEEKTPPLQLNLFVIVGVTYLLLSRFMGAAQTAMLVRVSDARYGATYMALFKTVLDFGSGLVGRIIQFIIQTLTIQACNCGGVDTSIAERVESCPPEQMKCRFVVDGLLIVGGACFISGFVLLRYFGQRMQVLDKLNESVWQIKEEIKQE